MPQRVHKFVQMPGTDRHPHNRPSPTTRCENMTTSRIYQTTTKKKGMVPLSKHFAWTHQGYSRKLLSESQLTVVVGVARLWHTRFEMSFATFLHSSVWDHTSEEGRKRKKKQVLRVTSESCVDDSICSSQNMLPVNCSGNKLKQFFSDQWKSRSETILPHTLEPHLSLFCFSLWQDCTVS